MSKKLSGAFGMLSAELDDMPDEEKPVKVEKPVERPAADTNKPVSKKEPKASKPRPKGDERLQYIDPNRVRSWEYKDRQEEDLNDIDFEDLMRSISSQGQHQPIRVRPIKHKDYDYEEIYGFRRLHACKALGIKVWAVIEPIDDRKGFIAQLAENDDRTAPAYWRRAKALEKALDNGLYTSVEAMSVETGIGRSTIANYLRVAKQMRQVFIDNVRLQYCRRDTLFYFLNLIEYKDDIIEDWLKSKYTSSWSYLLSIPKADVEKSFKKYLANAELDKPKQKKKDGAKTYMGKAGKLFSITRKGDQVLINILKDGKRIMDDEELAEALQKIMDEKAES